jgi:hypothetical protein
VSCLLHFSKYKVLVNHPVVDFLADIESKSQCFGSVLIFSGSGSGSRVRGWRPIPDPDPIRIQGLNDQKLKEITAEKNLNFFYIKNCNLPIPRPP